MEVHWISKVCSVISGLSAFTREGDEAWLIPTNTGRLRMKINGAINVEKMQAVARIDPSGERRFDGVVAQDDPEEAPQSRDDLCDLRQRAVLPLKARVSVPGDVEGEADLPTAVFTEPEPDRSAVEVQTQSGAGESLLRDVRTVQAGLRGVFRNHPQAQADPAYPPMRQLPDPQPYRYVISSGMGIIQIWADLLDLVTGRSYETFELLVQRFVGY